MTRSPPSAKPAAEAHLKVILGTGDLSDAAQRHAGLHGGDDGRRRLHQDLDR